MEDDIVIRLEYYIKEYEVTMQILESIIETLEKEQ